MSARAWTAFAADAALGTLTGEQVALLDAYPVLRILELHAEPGLDPVADHPALSY